MLPIGVAICGPINEVSVSVLSVAVVLHDMLKMILKLISKL